MNTHHTFTQELIRKITEKRAVVRQIAAELRQMRKTERAHRTDEWLKAFIDTRRKLRIQIYQYHELLPPEAPPPGYEEAFDMWVVKDELALKCEENNALKKKLEALLPERIHSSGGDPQFTMQQELVTTVPATNPRRILKKCALISDLEHEWPTISKDLSEASRNGLSASAKKEGGWDVEAARAWADSRGKLKTQAHVLVNSASLWNNSVTRHKLA